MTKTANMKAHERSRAMSRQSTMSEAMARRFDAEATVLRNKAAANPAYKTMSSKAEKRSASASRRHADLLDEHASGRIPDPEGTAMPLSDSEGNYAGNADVAQAGGIGVKASNSMKSGKPATSADDAGVVEDESRPVVIGYGGRPLEEDPQDEELPDYDKPQTRRRRK